MFGWSPDKKRMQSCSLTTVYLHRGCLEERLQQTFVSLSKAVFLRPFQPPGVCVGLGDVIIPKSMHRDDIDRAHLPPPWTSVIFVTIKKSTPT